MHESENIAVAWPEARTAVWVVLAAGSCAGWQDTISRTPVPLPATDNVSAEVRAARDGLFPLWAHSSPYEALTYHHSAVVDHFGPRRSEMPSAEAVIAGRVTDLTPRLVPDSELLYTEYSFFVESIVKNDSAWRGGENAVAIAPGGITNDAAGNRIVFDVRGLGQQIETGEHYLMFLRYHETAKCFGFVEVWRIEDGKLRSRARNDSRVASLGGLEGQPLDAVITRIRAATR